MEISDIVGQIAHRSYFVQLRDGNFYHYPTDKIYTLIVVRPELEQPMNTYLLPIVRSSYKDADQSLRDHNIAVFIGLTLTTESEAQKRTLSPNTSIQLSGLLSILSIV